MTTSLHQLLVQSAERWPNRMAVTDAFGSQSYAELSALSDRLKDHLAGMGVGVGDRVGICLRKSIDSLAAIFGVLKSGAAYVPVGPDVPAARNAFIFSDCKVKVIISEQEFETALRTELAALEFSPELLVMERSGGGRGMQPMLEQRERTTPVTPTISAETGLDDLAYILYTSGSTGRPKGVMLTHRNGLTFVEWCSEVLQPTIEDCFSSHAPFHFDLSILDIYVPLKHGSTLCLISEAVGKDPMKLADLIGKSHITVWYSTPSVLTMLTEYGHIGDYDLTSIRMILFAGEVYPIKHLAKLMSMLPKRRYLNLYGPTETNVCTFYELPLEIPSDQSSPFPIGKVCSHLRGRVVDAADKQVPSGVSGELCITGPGVMHGYWNRPEQTHAAFIVDPSGEHWYRTGDLVEEDADGNYRFLGRKDRMVKRRGFRVELGEIESTLYRHEQVDEAAVVAVDDETKGMTIKAYLNCNQARPSIIALKRFCADNLPVYMVPDVFQFLDSLPKTSTDKIDYECLKQLP
jgi:amino acid adenylation domain-containing protein